MDVSVRAEARASFISDFIDLVSCKSSLHHFKQLSPLCQCLHSIRVHAVHIAKTHNDFPSMFFVSDALKTQQKGGQRLKVETVFIWPAFVRITPTLTSPATFTCQIERQVSGRGLASLLRKITIPTHVFMCHSLWRRHSLVEFKSLRSDLWRQTETSQELSLDKSYQREG